MVEMRKIYSSDALEENSVTEVCDIHIDVCINSICIRSGFARLFAILNVHC